MYATFKTCDMTNTWNVCHCVLWKYTRYRSLPCYTFYACFASNLSKVCQGNLSGKYQGNVVPGKNKSFTCGRQNVTYLNN